MLTLSRPAVWFFRVLAVAVLAFIYVPIAVVIINSFNASRSLAWPPTSFTTQWWADAAQDEAVRTALLTSLSVSTVATAVALLLGSLTAFAVGRYSFFGRESISFLVILPIALPGIVTGIALNNVFTSFLGGLTIWTLVIGQATFCIVVVYNNAVARLRRLGGNVEEASMDLGATRWRTFRSVTFPLMRSSLLAGGLLAFGLSFDEIIVTTFTAGPGVQTLPIWILTNLFRPNQAPVVNVVAAALVVVSILPIYAAQRLSGDTAHAAGAI